MDDLPRVTTLPIPKFSIGQKVFMGGVTSIQKSHPCPDCLGSRKWKVIAPSGAELEASCQRCCGGYSSSGLPSLDYLSFDPSVTELTVGSIEIKTAPSYGDYVNYMCVETGIGSGSVYEERKLHDRRENAQRDADAQALIKIQEVSALPEAMQKREFMHLDFIDANLKLAHDAIFQSWWAYRHLRDDVDGYLEGDNIDIKDFKSNLEWLVSYETDYRAKKCVFEAILQRIKVVDDEELQKLVAQLPYKALEKKTVPEDAI